MRLILDRIEENAQGKRIAVFELENEFVNINEDSMPDGLIDKLSSGIILEAEYNDGKITRAEILSNETEAKRQEMKRRLGRFSSKNRKER